MFNQYILILVWIGFMAILQPRFYREEYNELTGEYDWRVRAGFAFVVMLPIIWMAANRGYFADTTVYIVGYHNMPSSFSEIGAFLLNQTKDKGFYAFSAFLRVIFGYDHVPYLLTLALIQGISVVQLFRRYSTNYVFSIFLFVASSDYISWMFNGIRQFTAVTIILFATAFMLKKKYVPVLMVILLASTIHQSALLMIPMFMIALGEPWNKKTLLFITGTIVAVVFVGQFTDFMDNALQTTQYANVVRDYTEWNDDGTNLLRALVYSVPAIISFIYRKNIREYGDSVINFCTNMSIISMGIYLVSIVTSGIFIGRLPIYASLYSYILLSWEIDNLFGSNRKMIMLTAVFAYLIFYYYQMHITYGMI